MEKIEFKKQFEEIFEILGFVTVRDGKRPQDTLEKRPYT